MEKRKNFEWDSQVFRRRFCANFSLLIQKLESQWDPYLNRLLASSNYNQKLKKSYLDDVHEALTSG